MTQSHSGKPARRLAMRAARAVGRALMTSLRVFSATFNSVSGGGNAPLLPPDTTPIAKRSDYRP